MNSGVTPHKFGQASRLPNERASASRAEIIAPASPTRAGETPALLYSKLKSHFANWREWELNPIVIKELRQAVRSDIFSGMLLLLLTLLFLASVTSLSGQNILIRGGSEMGQSMFSTCLVVLVISSLVFIPLYTGIRLALERQRTDLIFFTPLPVTTLVHGKLLSGMCLAALFFSVCMPFMAFSSLLRGMDLVTIQFVLLLLFGATCVAILAAIAIASLPFHFFLKTFFGLAFTGGLVVLCGVLLIFFFGVIRSGAASLMGSSKFWGDFVCAFGMAAFAAMVSYGVSISFITRHRYPADPYGYYSKIEHSHD
jgi:hypothetical protein